VTEGQGDLQLVLDDDVAVLGRQRCVAATAARAVPRIAGDVRCQACADTRGGDAKFTAEATGKAPCATCPSGYAVPTWRLGVLSMGSIFLRTSRCGPRAHHGRSSGAVASAREAPCVCPRCSHGFHRWWGIGMP
jgi:hypothetical protein